MKNRFNDVVTVQYQKCCSDREEVRDFVDRIRDENPDIVFFRKEEIPDPTTEEYKSKLLEMISNITSNLHHDDIWDRYEDDFSELENFISNTLN